MSKVRLTRRAAALSLLAAGLSTPAALPAPARAAPLPDAACGAQAPLSQPFASWGDANEYRLVPGGAFAGSAPGWTLTGGASVVGGGDPFGLTGLPGDGALSLPAGASAQSPSTCVDFTQPTFRFLGAASAPGATVSVTVVYASPAGPVSAPVGTLTAGGSWQPSPTYQNGAQLVGALNGGTAQMALRFTAVSGTTQLDDIFVDPRMGWR